MESAAREPKDRRILIIDDNPEVRDIVADMLIAAGYKVVAFSVATEALDEVKGSHPIDLMLVDFAMPDMRGDRFAAEARTLRRTVPVMFITGYAIPSLTETERWVLHKPFSMASLIRMVEQAMQISGGAHRT